MEHIVMPPKQNLLQMLVFSHIIDKKLSENFSKPWKFLKIAVASVIVSYKTVSYKDKCTGWFQDSYKIGKIHVFQKSANQYQDFQPCFNPIPFLGLVTDEGGQKAAPPLP